MKSHQFEKLDSRVLLHADPLNETITPATEHESERMEVASKEASPSLDVSGEVALATHHAGHEEENPHPDDSVLAGEHLAVMELVPHSQATHRAAADGLWSSASTWQDGLIPDDGAHVLVPEGIAVEVDGIFSARLRTIRVDGTIDFASDVDTQLIVDTFVVAVGGTLHIGTSDEPIAADVSVNILFTDDGPIDTTWDPKLFSRGLVSHGNAEIYGAAKTGPVDLATPPEIGDSTLELTQAVEGWQVGDRVLVPGVIRPLENNQGVTQYDEDEIVTISAISPDGLTVEFDQPLQYDHVPPRVGLEVPVSNLDRNVQFRSENTTDPQRAGHVMFMHSPNASVNFASFDHIGRNDKSIETTDPDVDEFGVLIPETGTNARGRYAVHFHRMGSESSAATIYGSVVENSPGWGFVNHDSNAIFEANTSYNVKGAGFVTEVGSERGAFISNLAVRSRGKNFYQPLGASDKGDGAGFGSSGHGFWLQSASVALIDNVAAGHAQEGIFIHSRAMTEFGRDLPTYASLIDTPIGTPLEYSANANEPAIRGDEIRTDQAAMAEMSGNKVFASGAGVGFRWRRQSDAVLEGTNGDVFENFQIWNVEWAGIHLGYVSGLMLSDGLILGNLDDPISLSSRELDDRSTEPSEFHTAGGKGIAANRNSKNLVFQNLEIAGFTVGIQALTQSNTRIDTVLLQNIEDLVIVTPQATEQSGNQRRIDATNIFHIPLSAEALNGETQYNVRLLKQLERSPVAGGSSASQEWSSFTAGDEIYYNGHRLFFYDQAGDAIPFPASVAPDFMTNLPYSQYLDQTNQQLLENFGLSLGDAIAPSEAFDAFDSMGVAGLAVPLSEPVLPPDRVEFGVDSQQNPTTWTLAEENLQVTWRSKAVSETAQWRVYLVGEDTSQEIGRSGVMQDYGHVLPGATNSDWQHWEFHWPTVGVLPPQWGGAVGVGEFSLIAVVDSSPAVYLGRVTLQEQAADPLVEMDHHAIMGNLPADLFLIELESAEEPGELDILAIDIQDNSPTEPIDQAHTGHPSSRIQPPASNRTAYRLAGRLSYREIDAALVDDDDLFTDLE